MCAVAMGGAAPTGAVPQFDPFDRTSATSTRDPVIFVEVWAATGVVTRVAVTVWHPFSTPGYVADKDSATDVEDTDKVSVELPVVISLERP